MKDTIDNFCWNAEPYLTGIRSVSTCIEQCRLLLECLRRFGVEVQVVQSILIVECKALRLAYISGGGATERALCVRKGRIEQATSEHEGRGHVIAFVRESGRLYIIDPSISQASMPDYGMVIPDELFVHGPLKTSPQVGSEIFAGLTLAGGLALEARWIITASRAFESTPAWEPSHLRPLINSIVREMRATDRKVKRKRGAL